MGISSLLFGLPPPKPIERHLDATLGDLEFSEVDDAWIGAYGGYRIAISDWDESGPPPELVEYASKFIGPNGAAFAARLSAAKQSQSKEFQCAAEEFAGLKAGTLNFSVARRGLVCFVELIGGEPNRSWRAEFRDEECEGIGFNT